VLDGFVIARNTVEQVSLDAAKGKIHAFKKHSLVILVSIVVHLLLALLLFFIAAKPQIKEIKTTKQAIHSYLYKMPAMPVVKPVRPKKAVKTVGSAKVNIETATKKTVQATFSAYQQLNRYAAQ